MEALEKKARECVARGEHRRAMEGYKRLFKIDPEAFRDPLVAAGAAYFGQCLTSSRSEPAEAVVRALDGVAPASLVAAMRLRLALANKKDAVAVALAVGLLGDPAAAPEDRRCAADALVGTAPEQRGDLSWPELALIDQALADAAAGNYAAVAAAMRALPRQSPFAHWRLFFKAVCAHAAGDAETAGKALALLDGGCAGVARAWIAPDAGNLATAVALLGEEKVAANLAALVRLDDRGEYASAFVRLIDCCRDFPAVARGIAATLGDYLTARMLGIEIEGQESMRLSRKAKEPGAGPETVFAIGRLFFEWLMRDEQFAERDARLVGNLVAEGRAAFPEHADSTEAYLLHRYAAKLLDKAEHPAMKYAPRLASEWLARAVEICPERSDAALGLVHCYLMDGRVEQCDAALAKVLKRFPTDLEVLFQAGRVSMRRGRYEEGLAYLLDLLARDPLSVKARSEVIHAAVESCEAYLMKKDITAAKRVAEIACSHSQESLPAPVRPTMILLQCGSLFEFFVGAAGARPYYDRAALRVAEDVFTYQRFVLSRMIASYQTPGKPVKLAKSAPKSFLAQASLAHVPDMVDFFVMLMDSMKSTRVAECESLLCDYVEAAVARDPDWRVNAIRVARRLLGEDALYEVLTTLAETAGERAPRDAVATILEIATYTDFEDLPKVKKARARLGKEGFADAVAFCDELHEVIERRDREHQNPYGHEPGGMGLGPLAALADLSREDLERALDAILGTDEAGAGRGPKKKTAKTAKKATKKSVATEKDPDDGQLDLPF